MQVGECSASLYFGDTWATRWFRFYWQAHPTLDQVHMIFPPHLQLDLCNAENGTERVLPTADERFAIK